MCPLCLLLVFPHVLVCLLMVLSFLTCLHASNLFIWFMSACSSLCSCFCCLSVFELSHISFVHAVCCSYISCIALVDLSSVSCVPAVYVFMLLLTLYYCWFLVFPLCKLLISHMFHVCLLLPPDSFNSTCFSCCSCFVMIAMCFAFICLFLFVSCADSM